MKITDQELAKWCANQRSAYNKQLRTGEPRISESHVRQLEAVPGWKWNVNDAAFEHGVEQFKKYGNQPQKFVTPDGYALGAWITSTRHQTKDPERRKILESLPGWVWNTKEARWMENYQKSMEVGMIPSKTSKLGSWQAWQRTKTGRSGLNKQQEKMLEKIPGWKWDASFRMKENTQAMMKEKSDKTFSVGIKYTKKYGLVPVKFVTPDGYKLGIWQCNQRSRCKNPEQRKILESIPGWKWQFRKDSRKRVNEN